MDRPPMPPTMGGVGRFVAALLAIAPRHVADGCSNFIASKGATSDGAPQLGYNSDGASFYGYMEHLSAGDHATGKTRKIWEFGTGRYMGEIPEAAHTYNVVGMMNEHGLSIGETTFEGVSELSYQEGAIIDYYSLIWLALQRSRNAREAIAVMDALTKEHGYASSGESFSLVDPAEAWVMDFIGRGSGEKGAVWVARRIPDGYVGSHANQARIRTFPRNSPDTVYSPDVVEFAKKKGLYPQDGSDADFSFADVFDPITPIGARLCEARVWDMFRQIVGSDFGDKYLDYAQGHNLENRMPLFVKPSKPVDVNTTMWLMRSHYEDSWFDSRDDFGASPFHSPYRARPVLFKREGKLYAMNRNVGYLGTFFHFVSQARAGPKDLPCAGGITWFGVDDPSLNVRVPMYSCTQRAPLSYAYGYGSTGRYERRAAYWAFNMVANFAYSRWDTVGVDVQRRVAQMEQRFLGEVRRADEEVSKKLSAGTAPAVVAKYLSDYSIRTADALVDNWVDLFPELFVRYRDFLVCPPAPSPAVPPDRLAPPQCHMKGYDDTWYSKLVADTGDKYLVPAAAGHEMQRLSLQKLRTASAGLGADIPDDLASTEAATDSTTSANATASTNSTASADSTAMANSTTSDDSVVSANTTASDDWAASANTTAGGQQAELATHVSADASNSMADDASNSMAAADEAENESNETAEDQPVFEESDSTASATSGPSETMVSDSTSPTTDKTTDDKPARSLRATPIEV